MVHRRLVNLSMQSVSFYTQTTMRITLIQTDIAWEDKQENLRRLQRHLEELKGQTDLVVLPETFTTGFSMNAERLAEPLSGPTVGLLRQWASQYATALAGSFIARHDDGSCRNRFFFLTPEGEATYYDKRHLFRMGHENECFAAGSERPIIHYRGFRILPQVCYDLRFPVWSRNVGNEYDLALYVACWPSARRHVWDVLLQARAMENQCYVCGVNRTGTDGNRLAHDGGSALYSPKGERLASLPDGQEGRATVSIDLAPLQHLREKFPVAADADAFVLQK